MVLPGRTCSWRAASCYCTSQLSEDQQRDGAPSCSCPCCGDGACTAALCSRWLAAWRRRRRGSAAGSGGGRGQVEQRGGLAKLQGRQRGQQLNHQVWINLHLCPQSLQKLPLLLRKPQLAQPGTTAGAAGGSASGGDGSKRGAGRAAAAACAAGGVREGGGQCGRVASPGFRRGGIGCFPAAAGLYRWRAGGGIQSGGHRRAVGGRISGGSGSRS